MKLTITKRLHGKKSQTRDLRRRGIVPAVVYSRGQPGEPVSFVKDDLNAILRSVRKGALSTTILTLVDDQGRERRVIVKDIQYHLTSYEIIHLDFEELHDDVQVCVRVPIEPTGVVECIGIKHGGVLNQVVRSLRVKCLPKDIPDQFQLDVRDLEMRQFRRLADISIPDGVRPMQDLKELAMVIAKR